MRLISALALTSVLTAGAPSAHAQDAARFTVSLPDGAAAPVDGRVLLLFSTDDAREPRFQISDTSLNSQQVFGVNVDGFKAGDAAPFDAAVLGYPMESLRDIPAGTYNVQALLHKYETFKRSDGFTLKLPMDRGEGQQWSRAPGNLYSTPRKIAWDPKGTDAVKIVLDKTIPPIPEPATTKYIKHDRIRSELLSKFWGRDMYIGVHVLLPEGFDAHPNAHYPLVINQGHFPDTIGGFSEQPPDKNAKCVYSERFHLDCYNRIEDEQAYQFYKDWTARTFPRFLMIEIQHPTPYYDDSYAVNSANNGPYGDAIVKELIPYVEKKYRGLGTGWSRFMYGGSTGGWEALAAQVFYPDDFNGCYAACPDPIDFHAHMTVNVYDDKNAFYWEGPFKKVMKPAHRNYLGHLSETIEQGSRLELVLGTKVRSGGQLDVWESVFSPTDTDGYPKRIWDRRTGVIDKDVAKYWQDNFDLVHIMKRDWEAKGLGKKLDGKVNLYVGDMDNYYLTNAVYLAEDFLRSAKNPPFTGEIEYGDRAEHCWNGDHKQPNAISRLRYTQMYAPKIVERILKTAPKGADITSWRY